MEKRICAALLAMMLTLSMSAAAFDDGGKPIDPEHVIP